MRRVGAGWIVLGLASAYFLVPLVMTVAFSLWQGGGSYGLASYRVLLGRPELPSSLLSVELAVLTSALLVVLLLPAMIFMNLFAPRLRPVFEFVAALPFVVPAIALVAGLTALFTGPEWLVGSPFYLVIP